MRTAKRRLPHNCYELQARRTRPYGPTHESSSCSHIDVPCGLGDQTCDVAIFAQAEARLSITTLICHCQSSTMSFSTTADWKWYGYFEVPENSWFSRDQRNDIWAATYTSPWIREYRGWGLFVGSTCTTQCKACFGYRTRSMLSDRSLPSAYNEIRPLLTRYNPSVCRGLTWHVCSLKAG